MKIIANGSIRHTLFAILFLPVIALAEEGKYEMEEVIVSAERTEESLLEIPLSVSVFDTKMLEDYNITSNKDLEVRTPGLQFGLDSPATIRGVGAFFHREALDLSVAMYSNDLYFREMYGVVSSLYDMDRVEVLRGPQGTLYGRNSIGGAINYINKRPEWEFGYGLTGELTNFNGKRFAGFVTGPFNEYWSFRLTAEWQDSDGMQKNIAGEDGNSRGDYNISPQIAFKYGKWDMNLRYAHFDADRNGDQRVVVTYPDTTVEFHREPRFGFPSSERNQYYLHPQTRPPSNDGGDLEYVINKNRTERNPVERDGVNLHLGYEINDNWNLRYIYGNSNVAVGLLNSDGDQTSVVASSDDQFVSANAGVPFNDEWVDAYFINDIESHELQLTFENDRVFAMFGVYDLAEDIFNNFNIFNTADPLVYLNTSDVLPIPLAFIFGSDPAELGPGITAQSYFTDGSGKQLDVKQRRLFEAEAVFGQVNIAINDQWSLIVGARRTKDTKTSIQDIVLAGAFADFGFPVTLSVDGTSTTLNFSKTTGNVTLEYAHDEDQLIYARLATGYKAGAPVDDIPPPFDKTDPEEIISLEVGYKADLMDDRLRLLVSGFIYDFDNYQQLIYQDIIFPTGPRNVATIANLRNTDLMGVEIEGTFHVTEDFTISGFIALQESELGPRMGAEPTNPNQTFRAIPYTNLAGQDRVEYLPELFDFTGNELPSMPKEKFSINGDYDMALADSDVRFSLSYSWTGKRHSRISNLKKDELDGYGRWDGSITWSPRDKDLEVSLFVENIADVIGIQELESNSFASGYGQDATLTNPRYYGLVVRWVN
ncbi:MAG TPA: hypothetical protein DCM54_06375 [Gammaproteobacteria bacterium]|nr:hypothetical protein [Gammaproteobacteria bacterium]